jgi:hypothetical protein
MGTDAARVQRVCLGKLSVEVAHRGKNVSGWPSLWGEIKGGSDLRVIYIIPPTLMPYLSTGGGCLSKKHIIPHYYYFM